MKLGCFSRSTSALLPLVLGWLVQPVDAQLITRVGAGEGVCSVPMETRSAAPTARPATSTAPPPRDLRRGARVLQVGAFESAANAAALQRGLEPHFGRVSVVPVSLQGRRFYRVLVEGFATPQDLESASAALRDRGVAAFPAERSAAN